MTDHNIATISVNELKTLLDENPRLCLIDVREQDEWEAGQIPGAIHIPKGELTTAISMEVTDLNQPVYLHCQGGVRSAYAAGWLMDMGYKKVYSVDGGIAAWAAEGFPIVV